MLSIIVLASAPKETFDKVLTDTVIEEFFGAKKWFQSWNNKVAFDVVVNTKNYGEVKIAGIVWTAIVQNDNDVIEKGDKVKVLAINGNKLIVTKVKE